MGEEILEILEFNVSGQSFGIDVVQVKEILNYCPITPVPNAHPNIEGIFMPRDKTITAIDLKKSLNRGVSGQSGTFIVTQYADMEIALHVDNVMGIHRVEGDELIPVQETRMLEQDGYMASVLKKEDRLIVVLNFERIISEVNPEAVNTSDEAAALLENA